MYSEVFEEFFNSLLTSENSESYELNLLPNLDSYGSWFEAD